MEIPDPWANFLTPTNSSSTTSSSSSSSSSSSPALHQSPPRPGKTNRLKLESQETCHWSFLFVCLFGIVTYVNCATSNLESQEHVTGLFFFGHRDIRELCHFETWKSRTCHWSFLFLASWHTWTVQPRNLKAKNMSLVCSSFFCIVTYPELCHREPWKPRTCHWSVLLFLFASWLTVYVNCVPLACVRCWWRWLSIIHDCSAGFFGVACVQSSNQAHTLYQRLHCKGFLPSLQFVDLSANRFLWCYSDGCSFIYHCRHCGWEGGVRGGVGGRGGG